jgi:hypothetical protein
MKETIYLIVNQNGIQTMRKTLPNVRRGEIPVKLNITIPKEAFAPPTLVQDVVVNDWRQGIELQDVEFRESVITPEEAQIIRERRVEKMKEVLEGQGYTVVAPDEPQP